MLSSDVYEELCARSAPHRSLFPLFIPVSHKEPSKSYKPCTGYVHHANNTMLLAFLTLMPVRLLATAGTVQYPQYTLLLQTEEK